MTRLVPSLFAVVLTMAPVVAHAQSTQPSGLPTPDASLWPERPLAPAEQELRDAVIVLRDTLYSIEATANRMERGLQGPASVLLATGRALHEECTKGSRASGAMRAYAAGLSTNNARWGDIALDDFRKAVGALERAMGSCGTMTTTAIAASPVDADKLRAAQQGTVTAIREYERSVKGLLRTLRIPLDPRGSRAPVIN